MNTIAAVVLVVLLAISLWAWRLAPSRQAAEQFIHIWRAHPWGKQFYLDFFGLQVMLALWMLADAGSRDALRLALACIATMPIFGAMSAALYWLAR